LQTRKTFCAFQNRPENYFDSILENKKERGFIEKPYEQNRKYILFQIILVFTKTCKVKDA
jgi:hypothetical protein